ncbi:MAG: hypothetical protein GXP22_06025 [Gammaproteobacteria bacterium]|nr:hypothetical protein [Gammaproteobacteria bacterium]
MNRSSLTKACRETIHGGSTAASVRLTAFVREEQSLSLELIRWQCHAV